MNLIKSALLLFAFSFISFLAIYGQIPEKSSIPNYISRNEDFQARRQTTNYVNFAKHYFEAENQLPKDKQHLDKAKDEWSPRGPFGKTQLAGTGRVNSMQFHPTDTNIWYICVAQGGVWKTTNAGKSWISISGDLPILRTSYLAVHPTNPDIMYVALGDFAYIGHNLQANENKRNSHYGMGIYKTTNGGENWSATGLSFNQTDFEGSLIGKIFIHPTNPNKLTAVGQTGSYVSDDAGKSWTNTSKELFWDLERNSQNPNILYATTGYVHTYKYGKVGIYKSDDFGNTWSQASTPLPQFGQVQRVEIAVAPSDTNLIYAIACDTLGGFYGFYKSTDGGKNYSTQTSAKTYPINLLNYSMDSVPGGQGRYDLAICVDRYNKNRVLIGGINMWQTTDGGMNFKPVTYWLLNYYQISLHADIHEIVQHPTNKSFFACHDGGISRAHTIIPDEIDDMVKYNKSSTKWDNYTNGLNISSFYRLSIGQKNPKQIIAGAQDNSTVYADEDDFSNLSGGDGMESVIDDANYYRYTSSQYGNIYAYTYYSSIMRFDEQFEPPAGQVAEWTSPMSSADGYLYVLYGDLYTAYGGSIIDKKSNFDNISGLSYSRPGTALAVEKNTGNRIYLAKRGYNSINVSNEIWTSANNGTNWFMIGNGLPTDQYPSYLEMNQQKTDEAWITFSGFHEKNKVYTTKDAGKTWKNITYDLPNIPVNCIVYQQDATELIYIGTDLGVYYLEKDSINWQYYSTGLPKVIVSELEIDAKNNNLVAATFGRGLWEIGVLRTPDSTVNINKITVEKINLMVEGNPTNGVLNLKITHTPHTEFTVSIIDVTGKTIVQESKSSNTQITNLSYNLTSLNAGVYYVVLQSSEGRFVRKVSRL